MHQVDMMLKYVQIVTSELLDNVELNFIVYSVVNQLNNKTLYITL